MDVYTTEWWFHAGSLAKRQPFFRSFDLPSDEQEHAERTVEAGNVPVIPCPWTRRAADLRQLPGNPFSGRTRRHSQP